MRQLGVTLSSVVLSLLLSLGLFVSHSTSVSAASTLYANTSAKEVHPGDRIVVDVKINSTDQSINAVSGVLLFPDGLLRAVSIGKEGTIINLWTRDPSMGRGRISFEGIVLNPGFQGSSGTIFRVVFEAKRVGTAKVSFIEGAILANDGLGTNIATSLSPTNISIVGSDSPIIADIGGVYDRERTLALPVITEYSASIGPESIAYVKGKGEPGALTKIVFKDASFKSIGEQFISSLQTKKKNLSEVLVKNDPESGQFEYSSSPNLVAGTYNAIPFLVDETTNTEKPGLGVQLLVNDSRLVNALVVLVNVLALLIPIVGLIVLIYFIPWYSFRRMRVIKRRLGLEEERLELSSHGIKREDKVMENTTEKLLASPEIPK